MTIHKTTLLVAIGKAQHLHMDEVNIKNSFKVVDSAKEVVIITEEHGRHVFEDQFIEIDTEQGFIVNSFTAFSLSGISFKFEIEAKQPEQPVVEQKVFTKQPQDFLTLLCKPGFRKLFVGFEDRTYYVDKLLLTEQVFIGNFGFAKHVFDKQNVVVDQNGKFTAIDNSGQEIPMKVEFSEVDSRITVEKMESIPVGDNPFIHDAGSMGTTLVRDIIVMHPGYDRKESPTPIGWIYLVNTRTGNRVKILIDDNF